MDDLTPYERRGLDRMLDDMYPVHGRPRPVMTVLEGNDELIAENDLRRIADLYTPNRDEVDE